MRVDNPRTPDIEGYIVGSKQDLVSLFVYIDKGRNDGLEVGDLLGIVSQPPYNAPSGHLQVIGVQETTSTAMIKKYQREVLTGDSGQYPETSIKAIRVLEKRKGAAGGAPK